MSVQDEFQKLVGGLVQYLTGGTLIKTFHGLTIHIKTDEKFKVKYIDKSTGKPTSTIPMDIDSKIRIIPNINIKIGKTKKK